MRIFTVRLTDGTIGKIDDASIDFNDAMEFIGDTVTVYLRDRNGRKVEETGELAEVIKTEEFS
jgi:hypothetical protein